MNTKFEFPEILFQVPSTIADEDSGDSLFYFYFINNKEHIHTYSQKAEMAIHYKGRLLNRAIILFNCISIQNGDFS